MPSVYSPPPILRAGRRKLSSRSCPFSTYSGYTTRALYTYGPAINSIKRRKGIRQGFRETTSSSIVRQEGIPS